MASEWRNVADHPPLQGLRVLVFLADGRMRVGARYDVDGEDRWLCYGDEWHSGAAVTHSRELPPKPGWEPKGPEG